jgi:hypothetical protein
VDIYHLERLGPRDVHTGQAQAFVVVADSEQRARRLAGCEAGDEGAEFWLRPRTSRCDVIGKAARGQNDGVVVRDFLHG